MPVVPAVSQSTLPHAQADGLAAEPSDIEQTAGGLLLQVLVAETQYMPVVSLPVHAAFPQMQGAALLGADPSVFVQAGAVRVHMHVRVVEQDVVEEVLVLKYREPEEVFQHPRGAHEYDLTHAVVSDHPCAVAPSSHSAWLPTHAPPLSSVHNPDVRA